LSIAVIYGGWDSNFLGLVSGWAVILQSRSGPVREPFSVVVQDSIVDGEGLFQRSLGFLMALVVGFQCRETLFFRFL